MVCEWDFKFLKANYDPGFFKNVEHPSVTSVLQEVDREKTLADCFELFSKGDELMVNCARCDTKTAHKKEMRP